MPRPDSRATFALGEPRFFSIEAFAQTKDHEPHVSWFASYDEPINDRGYRTVVATLHAATDDASTTVTLGGHFHWASGSAQPKTRERLEKLIAESFALETMYDMARVQALAMLSVTELSIELPVKAPDAELRELSNFTDEDQESNSAELEQHNDERE